ncbi:hypothetical protein (homolog to MSU_0086) [Candidatus Mycoplasma haemominutum 'Birmingham 1']|uniref:Uncharacterized protein n=2 Tax=Candidatus Mycoplasma haematominutum TaxID=209446 RepID=G8C2M3_9MOLU|nr:hypothetical protein (homolog to MSU_0086) [Candidatus Mycoplasma haematominutum 'Birmingham 1']
MFKGYLGSKIYQTPFAISFSTPKRAHFFEPGNKLQNRLIKLQLLYQEWLPKTIKLLAIPVIQLYKKYYVESPEINKKVTDFLGRDVNTNVKDLTGFEKKEYLRYQKLFAEKQVKPYSTNIPWIPHMFSAKPHVVNFQEAIDYFRSLYISEAKKAAASAANSTSS